MQTPLTDEFMHDLPRKLWDREGNVTRKLFEYHCLESPGSSDAAVWYRSHQSVLVLHERASAGVIGDDSVIRMFRIQFDDGFEYDVFEDELVDSPKEFYRPAPPRVERIENA